MIRKYSPLTLAWKDSYKGGDSPSQHDHCTGMPKQEVPAGNVSESDTSDTSDSDKNCNREENEPEVGPDRIQIPSITNDNEVKSHVTHVTHVTPTQEDTTSLSYASNIIKCISKSLLSAKENERCKQSSLKDEQINIFYQVFNELENTSNLQPGSYSSDDKGTIGIEELRCRLVLVGKLTANDAEWIIKEMQRIGNIKEVMFDTFRKAS